MNKWLACLAALVAVTASAAVPTAERDALIALYHSTAARRGLRRGGWLGAAGTECTWYAVQCDENQATVIALDLYQNNLTGTIPAAIRDLKGLRRLYLDRNPIEGRGEHGIASEGAYAAISYSVWTDIRPPTRSWVASTDSLFST